MKLMELPYNIENIISTENVSLTFNNEKYIVGNKNEEIANKIVNALNVNNKLVKYGIDYFNSLLLYGEPECGQKLFCKYIAFRTNLPFIYINCSDLIANHLGETGRNISEVFKYVSSITCVCMIDDIDAIGLSRDKENFGEISRIVLNLIQHLNKFNNGTVLIGATNREDMLDIALKRKFSLKHKMELPNRDIRIEIVKTHLSSLPNVECSKKNIETFVDSTTGYSYTGVVNSLVSQIITCFSENKPITLTAILDANNNDD